MDDNGWISVDDELPGISQLVLLYADIAEGVWTVGRRYQLRDEVKWWTVGNIPIPSITHWQPLPNPPK